MAIIPKKAGNRNDFRLLLLNQDLNLGPSD